MITLTFPLVGFNVILDIRFNLIVSTYCTVCTDVHLSHYSFSDYFNDTMYISSWLF